MWLVASALADTFEANDSVDFCDALASADAHAGADTIEVSGARGDDCGLGRADVVDQELTITGVTADATIPPLWISNATVTVGGVGLTRQESWAATPNAATDLGVARISVAIVAEDATLELDTVTVTASGPALALVDTQADLLDVDFSGATTGPSIYAGDEDGVTALRVVSGKIHDNAAGGLFASGAGTSVVMTGMDSAFADNAGVGWADLRGEGARTIDVTTTHFTGSVATDDGDGVGAPVRLTATPFSCNSCEFTETVGSTAWAVYADAGFTTAPVVLEWTNFDPSDDNRGYGVRALGGADVTLTDGWWSLPASAGPALYVSDGDLAVSGTLFEHGDDTPVFYGEDGAFSFTGATICDVHARSPILTVRTVDYSASLALVDSTVHGSASDAAIVSGTSPAVLTLQDDTFASNTGALAAGTWGRLDALDVLAYQTDGLDLDAVPNGAGHYNLWWGVTQGANLPVVWDEGTDVAADPKLDATFVAGDCKTYPLLTGTSPAIDAGDPDAYYADDDGSRADIGAWDYGAAPPGDTGGSPGDTGDTADTDDSGVVDSGDPDRDGDGAPGSRDCDDDDPDVFPRAVDTPDDGVDQDCSGADATFALSGGRACGCGGGADAAWLLLPLAWRRRRA